ncbi:MAG TPA: F0F1 ATP synthase subunit delta [Pseudogracilibacillus sp.]|nr:F0F1 ATP synthase subunit delta [Pseudogracilibacillus sp.]
MSVNVIAKRYAEALFQIGEENKTLDTLVKQFTNLKEVFVENEDFLTYMNHPGVSGQDKASFIDQVFKKFEPVVVNTLKLLVERQRVELTPSIIKHFVQLVNDEKGIAEVTVQSVRELNKAEKKQLEKNLAKRFDKKTVHITNIVNPDILGGLHIRIGNTIIDGTIKNKLHRIERKITSANKQ